MCYCCLSDSPSQKLKIIDLQQPDFLRTLENAVQFGSPVLLQNVQEELDPSLAPILNKSLIKQGEDDQETFIRFISSPHATTTTTNNANNQKAYLVVFV